MSSVNWKTEYEQFVASTEQDIPSDISGKILSTIHAALTPSRSRVFASLALIHLFAGTLTLFLCPQFGVAPFGGWVNLMLVVMPYGVVTCAIFCGTLYLGATALATHLLMSAEILRALERYRYQQFALLGGVSVLVLMLLPSTSASMTADLLFVSSWLTGGILISQWFFHRVYVWRGSL